MTPRERALIAEAKAAVQALDRAVRELNGLLLACRDGREIRGSAGYIRQMRYCQVAYQKARTERAKSTDQQIA